MRVLYRSPGALIVAACLALSPSAIAASESSAEAARHPLEPPDRSSPRASISTLTRGLEEGLRLYLAGDPAYREHAEAAISTLDTSQLPPRIAYQSGIDAALRLKEILDRLELPPPSRIPGAAEVARKGLTSWTVPHTEIELVRIEEGERAGQFLFSARTVARVGEFYERVRDLPYQPGKTGGHYDLFRSGASSNFGRLAASLPAWTRAELGNQLVWQWAFLVVLLALAGGIVLLAYRVSSRRVRPPGETYGRSSVLAVIPPLTMIAALWLLRACIARQLGLVGAVRDWLLLGIVVLVHGALAWLTTVLVTRGVEHLMGAAKVDRPVRMQMMRVLGRGLSLLLILMWIYLAGKAVGVPLTALVAGLGVGGLAVALAAQSTIENLIGGITLYADRPVAVGDAFRIGETVGFLEEVGLRSAKVRTRENTLIAIPNADFSKMQLENFSRRSKTLVRTTLHLGLETSAEQLRYIIARLYRLVLEHPELEEDKADAKLVGVAEYSFQVRYKGYAATTSWTRFKEIRQQLLFDALEIVEEAGARLAIPTELEYRVEDRAPDPERVRAAERQVGEWRARGELLGPPFDRSESRSELPESDDLADADGAGRG